MRTPLLKRVSWISWLAMVFLMICPSMASAQDSATEARARQYYAEGNSHFVAGRYAEAGAAFAAGFELSHKPGFLWNMAECARLSGNSERALELYKSYVSEAPDGKQRADAEKRIRELEPPAPPPVKAEPAPPPQQKAPPPAILLEPKPQQKDLLKPEPAESKPITQRWWFWTGAVAVVAGAVIAGVVIASRGDEGPAPPSGPVVDWRTP